MKETTKVEAGERAQTIYCRTDLETINLAADLTETLGKAGVR